VLGLLEAMDVLPFSVIAKVILTYVELKDVATEIKNEKHIDCSIKGIGTVYTDEIAKLTGKLTSTDIQKIRDRENADGLLYQQLLQHLDRTGDLSIAVVSATGMKGKCKAIQDFITKSERDINVKITNAQKQITDLGKNPDKTVLQLYQSAKDEATGELTALNMVKKDYPEITLTPCNDLPTTDEVQTITNDGKAGFLDKCKAVWATMGRIKECGVAFFEKRKIQSAIIVVLAVVDVVVNIVLEIFTAGIWKIIKLGWKIIKLVYYIIAGAISDDPNEKATKLGQAIGTIISMALGLIPGKGRRRSSKMNRYKKKKLF